MKISARAKIYMLWILFGFLKFVTILFLSVPKLHSILYQSSGDKGLNSIISFSTFQRACSQQANAVIFSFLHSSFITR